MILTEISAPSTPHGGPVPFSQPEPEGRRTPLRAVPAGGYVQVLRRPFARLCDGLDHDQRGALLWLLVEANRRHWGRPGTPVLTMSKKGLAEALGIERRRAGRILDRLVDAGAIAWTPGVGGLDGEVEVLAYAEVVGAGRRERGNDYCAVLCGPVDDALGALGLDAWAVLALATIEVGSVTQTIAGPVAGMAAHLGLTWYRLRPLVEGLADAGLVEWRPRTPAGARLRLTSYADVALSGTVAADRGEVRVDAAGQVLGREVGGQIPPRRPRKAATATVDDLEKPPRRHGKAATAPAVSPPALEEQPEEEQLDPLPPHARVCGTPPAPEVEDGGTGQGQASPVLSDSETDPDAVDAVLDALVERVEALPDPASAARLRRARDRRTRAVGRLRAGASKRLAEGWDPRDLVDETIGARPLVGATYVDAVLASRLDALPVEPLDLPRRVPVSSASDLRDVLVDVCGLDRASMTPTNCSVLAAAAAELLAAGASTDDIRRRAENYRATWEATLSPGALVRNWAQLRTPPQVGVRLSRRGNDRDREFVEGARAFLGARPPAWDLLDDGTAVPTGARPPVPGGGREVIDVDPGADEATGPPPGAPAGDGPACARQAPPPDVERPSTGDRTSAPLDDVHGGPQPSDPPPDVVAAPPPPDLADLRSLLRRPPDDDGPRRAVERPVASTRPPGPMTEDERAAALAASIRAREAAGDRRRALGLSA